MQAKKLGSSNLFRPAMDIVETVVTNVPEEQRFLLPKQKALKRAVNRMRAKVRPSEPKDLNFEVH